MSIMVMEVQKEYDAPRAMYRTLRAFYDADPNRAKSGEADYGRFWRLHPWPHHWRVSYIHATGEIYAVHQELCFHTDSDRQLDYGPVFKLGIVPPDYQDPSVYARELYYATLDRVLDGWPNACGKGRRGDDGNSLTWVRDRICGYQEAA